jgi:hypothetical protein
MPYPTYTWDAAFVAFCNGSNVEEISEVFKIPLRSVKQRCMAAGWRALRTKLPLITNKTGMELMTRQVNAVADAKLPTKVEARIARIEENRKHNLAVFAELREHLIEKVKAFKAGTLLVQKVFCTKGLITTYEAPPGPGDWVNIASYANQVAQGTYRALGDLAAQDKPHQDSGPGGGQLPIGPSITIILPAAVAQPREERSLNEAKAVPAAEVIDVAAAVTQQPESPQKI